MKSRTGIYYKRQINYAKLYGLLLILACAVIFFLLLGVSYQRELNEGSYTLNIRLNKEIHLRDSLMGYDSNKTPNKYKFKK